MAWKSFLAPLRLALVGLQLLSGLLQVALIYPHVGEPKRRLMKKAWSRQLLWVLGVRPTAKIPTADPTGFDGLLVCNHVSFVDVFVINAISPTSFIAKSDIAGWPVIGWLCMRADTLFIERGSRTAAHRAHRELVGRLGAAQSVAIFPEGTSSVGESVLPFHSALFQSAIDAGVPVQCMVLSYHASDGSLSQAPAYIGDISLLRCLWAIARCGGLQARLRKLPVMDTAGTDRRRLAQQAHQSIARGLTANCGEHADSWREDMFAPPQSSCNTAAMKQ